jgi:hypothetical protein
MNNVLFDYGEGLLCCLPLFFVIAIVGGSLLISSMPSKKAVQKDVADGDEQG